MDKFVVRTKLPPRPERKSAVIEDKKKQSTIESLAVRLHSFCTVLYIKLIISNVYILDSCLSIWVLQGV